MDKMLEIQRKISQNQMPERRSLLTPVLFWLKRALSYRRAFRFLKVCLWRNSSNALPK